MFSIDSFISGVLDFVRMFTFTFYAVLIKSKKFFVEVLANKIEPYTKPALFFIISLLAFVILSDPRGEFAVSTDELFNLSVDKKFIYTFPLAIVIYFFFSLIIKLLRLPDRLFKAMDKLMLYWWGVSLLCFLIYFYLYVLVSSSLGIQYNRFGAMYIVPLIIIHLFIFYKSLVSISAYCEIKTRLWYKFLTLPLFAISASAITYMLFYTEVDLLEPKYKTSFYVFQDLPKYRGSLGLDAELKNDSVLLTLNLYFANPTDEKIFIDRSQELEIYELPIHEYKKYVDYDKGPSNYSEDGLFYLSFPFEGANSHNNRFIQLNPQEVTFISLKSKLDTTTFNVIDQKQMRHGHRIGFRPEDGKTVLEISCRQVAFSPSRRLKEYFFQRVYGVDIQQNERNSNPTYQVYDDTSNL